MLNTLAHKKFFEDVENIDYKPEFEDILKPLLPSGWETRLSGVWLHARHPDHELPVQGFKIHLSTIPSAAGDVIEAASKVCFANNTPFKVSRDRKMLSIMNSKHYPRGNAGKLMTIYPKDEQSFRSLISVVHEATNHFKGPYILSDRRYGAEGVVYYRYGEILSQSRLTVFGHKQSELRAPDGSPYREDRLPFYRLPPWVSEPFPEPASVDEAPVGLIGTKYKVEKALAFSNGGGIYRGVESLTGQQVVLKEARPHTAQFQIGENDIDAFRLLAHERSVLEKLQGVPGVIKLLDYFSEWEHRFLVEEYFEGAPLRSFRARNDVNLLPFDGDQERSKNYCQKITKIFIQLIETIQNVHDRGVIIGDLSPANILIDPDSLEIRIIDFEGAVVEDSSIPTEFAARWATQGFKHARREESQSVGRADDWYALGMVLFSTILPMQELFDFEESRKDLLLDVLSASAGLPEGVPRSVRMLWSADPESAAESLRSASPRAAVAETWAAEADARIPQILDGIDSFISVTADPGRSDRLWPPDPEVFSTNPLSVAYGACGPLLYMLERGMEISDANRQWLLRKVDENAELPPGLYIGTSGVAHVLARMGEADRARSLLLAACKSPLAKESASLFHGSAGIILSCILTKPFIPDLDDAMVAPLADHLMKTAEACDGGICWDEGQSKRRQLGFALGGSGTAMALLYAGRALSDDQYTQAAVKAMDAEIASGFERDGMLVWGADTESVVSEPYWLHGGSGVGTALLRFYSVLGDRRYLDLAKQVAESSYMRFTVHPGLFEGMSGIGEFMLDMNRATGDDRYASKAEEIARSISLYYVQGQQSIGFLGRGLQRLSCDLGYGASGVGCFLNRLQQRGPRLLHD